MKQMLLAAILLAGLFVPGFAFAQYDCFLVCTPARVYCQPSGAPAPPIAKLCGANSLATQSFATALDTSDARVSADYVDNHINVGIEALKLIRRNGKSVRHLRFDE